MDRHEHDEQWIKEQMNLIRPKWRVRATELYKEKFTSVYAIDKDESLSRREANTLLRSLVDKNIKASI